MQRIKKHKHKLINDDALEVLPTFQSKSIDLILCDPPYGTTACKWDSVIPLVPMWKQLNRIIRSNRAVVLFGAEPFSSALRMANIDNYKYDWIWHKGVASNSQNCKHQPLKIVELISVFSSKTHLYKPQGMSPCSIMRSNKNRDKGVGHTKGCVERRKSFIQKKTGYPKNILKFKPHNQKKLHQTQKPVALIKYLIETYSNEGDTVLDFAMGSGTTGVACNLTNRNFIGIEKDTVERHFETAKKRIL
jgi:site-specific DNA-methyltransferase (adenine-specific)